MFVVPGKTTILLSTNVLRIGWFREFKKPESRLQQSAYHKPAYKIIKRYFASWQPLPETELHSRRLHDPIKKSSDHRRIRNKCKQHYRNGWPACRCPVFKQPFVEYIHKVGRTINSGKPVNADEQGHIQ